MIRRQYDVRYIRLSGFDFIIRSFRRRLGPFPGTGRPFFPGEGLAAEVFRLIMLIMEDRRPVCPIPHLGFCIYERCNFWDEAKQECSGLCFSDHSPLDDREPRPADGPGLIHWTEDTD